MDPLTAGTIEVKGTLENLQAAFNGESNASARYAAFAVKAREEGYRQVEKLFLAASKAEEIHAAKHAQVIRRMGGTPQARIETPQVLSTAENLRAAVQGETYERDVMYPAFITKAQQESNREALVAFKRALLAETEHARMYQAALDNLEAWRAVTMVILVCEECGFTTEDPAVKRCSACGYPREQFIEFK
jgi:rubrerythrin